jgi:hypothetical protein
MKLPTLKWFIVPALTMGLLLGALLIYDYQYVPAKQPAGGFQNPEMISSISPQR